jgi:fructose-1,6-bisphosphatase/inositol monophosphatase family enzyme
MGGPSALHGHCADDGDIAWADGNLWRRGARLSELVAVGAALAEEVAAAIRAARREQQQQQQQQQAAVAGSTTAAHGAAEAAGARTKAVTDEGVPEPVTMADAASNRVLVGGWRTHWPGIALLTEEAVDPALLHASERSSSSSSLRIA